MWKETENKFTTIASLGRTQVKDYRQKAVETLAEGAKAETVQSLTQV